MKFKVIVHEAEEGGYWAEVPSIPGCATEGDTYEELIQNIQQAIEGYLSLDISEEEKAAIEKGLEDIKEGRIIPHAKIKKQYAKWL